MTPSVDAAFRALADPNRRAMVARLSRGEASVSELAAPLELSLPATIQHLDVLQSSGLVLTEKRGRTRVCELRPEPLSAVERWLADHRSEWQTRFDRLGEVLGEEFG